MMDSTSTNVQTTVQNTNKTTNTLDTNSSTVVTNTSSTEDAFTNTSYLLSTTNGNIPTTNCSCYTAAEFQTNNGIHLASVQLFGIILSSFLLGAIIGFVILALLWKRSRTLLYGRMREKRKTRDSTLIRTATYKKRNQSDQAVSQEIKVSSTTNQSSNSAPSYLDILPAPEVSYTTESIYSNELKSESRNSYDAKTESIYSNDLMIDFNTRHVIYNSEVDRNRPDSAIINAQSQGEKPLAESAVHPGRNDLEQKNVYSHLDKSDNKTLPTTTDDDVYNHLGDSVEKSDNCDIYDHSETKGVKALQDNYEEVSPGKEKKEKSFQFQNGKPCCCGSGQCECKSGEIYVNLENDNYFILEKVET